jgi:hypothetical protein
VIVWVASYPRSGNNLALLTLGRAFGFRRGLSAQPDQTLRKFDLPPDADLIPSLKGLEETVFVKTHALPGGRDETPAVYLVRDGRDAEVSYAHWVRDRAMAEFAGLEFEAILERTIRHGPAMELLEGQVPPDVTWSDHVRAWTGRSAATAIVRFESLIEDPASVVGDAVRSLGIDVPQPRREVPSFDELRRRNPLTYRRGEVGTWREEMPPGLEGLFWELHGAQMEALGYPRLST